MRMFRYVARIYLKYFFIIAFALSFLFAGLDFMQQSGGRLNGFNIKILYLFYKGSYALDLLFPLALVFAMIVTKVILIRSNALLSFYALGYSKKAVLAPFIVVSLVLTLLYIGMHFSSFVDADLSAKSLLHGKRSDGIKRNLFVKYDENFIYIGQLIPSRKEALDIRLYRMKDHEMIQMIYGEKALFEGDRWVIKDAKIVWKPKPEKLGGEGFDVEYRERYETLFGFKPKILTSVFQGRKYYTIQDAWEAFRLLASQGLNTQRVRTLFYHMVVTPFFALFLVIIFFLSIPPYGRGMNLLLTSFVLTGTTLFIWGVLYLLFRVSQTGVVPPEYGMVLIVSLLGVVAFHHYAVRTNR